MTELLVLRGVPGSGKTTFADALDDYTSVNRDSIRFQMFGKYWGVDESVVTDVENTMVASALRAGQNVVLDATNLVPKNLRTKLSIAARHGATVRFRDFPIPLVDAVQRDARRVRTVGATVIEGFFKRSKINPATGILPPPPEPLVFERVGNTNNLPLVYIVDTDGTVANHEPHRSPYDTTKYHLDTSIHHVAAAVVALSYAGYGIIGLSGRDEKFRLVTEQWWNDNGIPFDHFLMRPEGDTRMDAIVKYELFKEYIEPHFNVLAAFDDRPQVIRMWETIGVPVLNVADGREF